MAYAQSLNTAAWDVPSTGIVGKIRAWLDAYRVYAETKSELSHLNDRTLADIGLTRGNIEDTARQAVRG